MKEKLKKFFAVIMASILIILNANVISIADYIDDEIVNLGVVIKMQAKRESVKTGEVHQVAVKSSYSNPNDKDYAICRIYMLDENGKPNTAAKLQGLVDNKKVFECENNRDLSVTLEMKEEKDENNNVTNRYLEYILPPGTTVEMELEFIVPNGISGELETLVLRDKVVHTTEIESNDKLASDLNLKWTSEFTWANLVKKSNNSKVSIGSNNKFSSNINYSFSAENSVATTGNIWTKTVVVNDTLTLPDGIEFPDDVTYNTNSINIGDKPLYNITLPDSYNGFYNLTNLEVQGNTIKFNLIIINPNVENGVLTNNFNPLKDLKTIFYASNLEVDPDYEVNVNEKINNEIMATFYPCVEDVQEIDLQAITSTEIREDIENYTIKKSVDKSTAKVGDMVTYTIDIKNSSRKSVTKTFIDSLPSQLELSSETIEDLRNNGFTVSDNNKIEKEITVPTGTTSIEIPARIKDTEVDIITNTASYGNKSSSVNVNINEQGLKLKKELTSRIVDYSTYGYNGDYDSETEGYKIKNKNAPGFSILGEGDLIEYTVTLENSDDEEKVVKLKDINPLYNSKNGVSFYYIYNNLNLDMKFGIAGDSEFNDYAIFTENHTDFYDNKINYVYQPNGESIVTLTIPANTTFKQTYILKLPKSVANGEQYSKSFDAYCDVMRYVNNVGTYAGDKFEKIPCNYIYVDGNESINSVVYHKLEPRVFVQKGVLGRSSYDTLMNGKALVNKSGVDLHKYIASTDEVVTFYAYFVNDSLTDLSLNNAGIIDKIPSGFEFLGFNNITKKTDGTMFLDAPSQTVTNRYNSYSFLHVNDSRANAPYDMNANGYKYEKENTNINWSYQGSGAMITFRANDTLKPGEGCYFIYSCRVRDNSSGIRTNTLKLVLPRYVYGKVLNSNSYTVDRLIASRNSSEKVNSNNGDSFKVDNKDFMVDSKVDLEPIYGKKNVSIKKEAYQTYKREGDKTSFLDIDREDKTNAVDEDIDGVSWKVTLRNTSLNSSIDASKFIEIIDSPFELTNYVMVVYDSNNQQRGNSMPSAIPEKKTITEKRIVHSSEDREIEVERNVYELDFTGKVNTQPEFEINELPAGAYVVLYFWTDITDIQKGAYYDTTIYNISDINNLNWEINDIEEIASLEQDGYSGIKDFDYVTYNLDEVEVDTGKINIEKIDKDTEEIITEDETTFKVFSGLDMTNGLQFVPLNINDEKGNHYRLAETTDTDTTDQLTTYNGKIQIEGVELDTAYYVKEIEAPYGYKLGNEYNRVFVNKIDNGEKTVRISNKTIFNKIKIEKVDYAENLITEGTAKFELYDNLGNIVYLQRLENSENSAEYKISNSSEEGSVTVIETYKGKANISEALVGNKYNLKEVEAPTGYLKDETILNINIISPDEEYKYKIKNGKNSGNVIITKVDSQDNVISSEQTVFMLYNEDNELIKLRCDDEITESGRLFIYDEDDTSNIVSRLMTEQGMIRINNLPLGKYYLKEVVAPSGYSKLEEDIQFTVTKENDSIPLNVKVGNYDYVFGQEKYVSTSYQKIEEKDNPDNYGYGYTGKEEDYEKGNYNYIIVSGKDKLVQYTLRVFNMSQKNYERLTLINKLPDIGDTGAVNLNEQRESEFTVKLAENPEWNLIVYSEDGEERVLNSEDYIIEFSDEIEYTNSDWDGQDNGRWYSEPKESTKSFRVKFNNNFELLPTYGIKIKFNGQIQENAKPGQIAWNSFGYRYYVGDVELTAEPPKVGVMIPEKEPEEETVEPEEEPKEEIKEETKIEQIIKVISPATGDNIKYIFIIAGISLIGLIIIIFFKNKK